VKGAAQTAAPVIRRLGAHGGGRIRALPGALITVLLAASAAAPATALAQATEYRSIGVPAAVLYDGPSTKGKKLFVAPRGMPLEVVSTLPQWVKVRDMVGDVMWIERKDLAAQRTLVTVAMASVRKEPQDSAPLVFQAERGVLLDWVDAGVPAGWARVRHKDGVVGFVRATEVWGL
jgi:SH3-like domain-containing protein